MAADAPTRMLTAFEHQEVPVGGDTAEALSWEEADCLADLGETRRGFCQRGHRTLRLAQYCGVVNLGSRTLEILPKVHDHDSTGPGRSLLLGMLRLASEVPVFRTLPVGHATENATLLDVFIRCFLDATAALVKGGLLRQYLAEEEDLRVVRGKIVARRQFAGLANRTDLVACAFDDLTVDNRWNRIVRAGLRLVMPHIRSASSYTLASSLVAAFDEISPIDVESIHFDRLRYNRQAARYQPAVQWVELLARALSPNLRAGRTRAHGLLIDMNALFEAAATALLRRTVDRLPDHDLSAQDAREHLAFAGEGRTKVFRLRPDMVVRSEGRPTVIADAKWKRVAIDPRRIPMPNRSDVFQMLAYASRYECRELQLVYPWHSGLEGTQHVRFRLQRGRADDTTLRLVFLDFTQDPPRVVGGDEALYWQSADSSTPHSGAHLNPSTL